MTDNMMGVQALLGRSADADFLRGMIGFAAQRLMDLEVGGLTGAGYGEKSGDRLVQRNGYRDRDWETRGRHRRVAHPSLADRQLFPGLPRTPTACREGTDRGGAGGVHPGHLDPAQPCPAELARREARHLGCV